MKCPQCRAAILTAERDLPTNYTLKNMAKQAREDEKKMGGHHNKKTGVSLVISSYFPYAYLLIVYIKY